MKRPQPVIAPAIMADEWDVLVSEIERVAPTASRIQIDVMDGHLVPSFSFPYNKTMLSNQQLPHKDTITFDVHLMVQHPQEVGHRFIDAGASCITAQIEGFRVGEAQRVYEEWKDRGANVGVSLLLDTPLSEIVPLIENDAISLVQVMSIARIGYQGEAFDGRAISRVRILRERYPDVTIAVDGGVHAETLPTLRAAGADIFNIGSAIMHTNNPEQSMRELQTLLDSYIH